MWNPWHGCHKISEGCLNCYMFRMDARFDKESSIIQQTTNLHLPLSRKKDGSYKYPSNTTFYTCFTSDFFLEEADEWRKIAYDIMRERSDCRFFLTTKRIDRFFVSCPHDFESHFKHVCVAVTIENQRQADIRLPIYITLPIARKELLCEPLLSDLNLSPYLGYFQAISVGGESGDAARVCDFEWVKHIAQQAKEAHIPFTFRQTGAKLLKDGHLYRILRKDQFTQALKANLNTKKSPS